MIVNHDKFEIIILDEGKSGNTKTYSHLGFY